MSTTFTSDMPVPGCLSKNISLARLMSGAVYLYSSPPRSNINISLASL